MLRGGLKRICDGGGTSCPEPNVTEYDGMESSLDGNANFSESYVFSTGELYSESVSSSCALTTCETGSVSGRRVTRAQTDTHGNA